MALVRDWIIAIITVIIFATFIEILIPNSSYKRYVNVVIGFLFIIIILTPLAKFINGQINFEDEILKTLNQLEFSTAQNRINDIQYINKETIITLYKNQISKQIKNHIENKTEYIVSEVDIEVVDDDNEKFGLIKNFNIALKKNTGDIKPANKIIEPIQIGVSMNGKNNNTTVVNSVLINNKSDLIKNDISNLYNIPKDKISIHILKNN